MAHITQTGESTRSLGETIAAPFRAIVRGMIWLAEIDPRYARLSELAQMSDAELARRGLRREQIVQHVMGQHHM